MKISALGRCGLVVLFALLGLIAPGVSDAILVIEFETADVADVVVGEDLRRYAYRVSGDIGGAPFQENQGFTIDFALAQYRDLQDPPPVANADWDALVLQPDSGIPADGAYDALALVNDPSLADLFTLTFVWLGAGAPGPQPFTVNQFDANGDLVAVLQSGVTVPLRSAVPNPASLMLVGLGLVVAGILARKRLVASGILAVIVSTVTVTVANAAPTIGSYVLVAQQRVSRTHSDFTYRASVTNTGEPAASITATLTGVPTGTAIVEGSLSFGVVPAGGVAQSLDTFTIRIDRRIPFDSSRLVWSVQSTAVNNPPVANAGPDQTAGVGSTATLNGSASSDPDGNPLTFAWAFVSRPAGSTAALSDPTAVMPTFVLDRPGAYVVRLVVNDGLVDSAPDTVQVSTVNSPPVANAGADQTILVTDTVTLDGSGSTDVDGNPLTFAWAFQSRPAGSAATLSDPSAVTPTFVVDRPGTYVVRLVVNDGLADSPVDTVTISTQNSRPVANAGPDQLTFVGSLVQLAGSGSSDVDGDSLTFQWAFVSRPAGSLATLSDPAAVNPTFVVDQPGVYVVQLIVNDGVVDSAPDTVLITTQNRPPVANAGPDQTVALGATVQLNGSGSSDPDTNPLTFAWSLISVPPGSTATLSNPGIASPTFIADRPGTYVAQLVVNDGVLDSAPDTVTISTENSVPVADAGPDQAVTAGVTVQLDGSGSTDADGTPLQFSWSLTTRPAGSSAVISDPSIATPTFVADLPGVYVAQLMVGDGLLVSAPDTVTITAQAPVVTLTATDANAAEAGANPGRFRFSRTGDTSFPLTVTYTVGGTASNGSDYTGIPTTITIPAGASTAARTITPIDDVLVEGSETVVLTLVDGAAYDLGAQTMATVTIADNDRPTVTVTATDASAAEAGSDPGTFTVTRNGPTTAGLQVFFTVGGSATSGQDYAAVGTSVTIPVGSSSATVTVTPADDLLVEAAETVVLTLAANAAYVIGAPSAATVTITDNDSVPVVTIAATDASASEPGANTGTFTVTRTGDLSAALTVDYSINGTAINGTDYTTIATSLTIGAGQASATVAITPINDPLVEGNETVVLTLVDRATYDLGAQTSATVTIADNPVPVVTIAATDASASEVGGNAGTFTITRTGNLAFALAVDYTVGGTATNGTDYATIATSVTIPASQASTTVTISPTADALVENAETVVLTLVDGAPYNLGAQTTATVTILDAPVPVVTIAATDAAAAEAGPNTGTFTITRTGDQTSALTVDYTIGGTATNGTDYTTIAASVTIQVGQASATVTSTPVNDALAEGDETVVLTLVDGAGYDLGAQTAATVIIADDDLGTVTVVATDASATEAGSDTGTFTFTRTGDTTLALVVNFTVGGTATVNSDYANTIGTSVTIQAGQTSVTRTVTPFLDAVLEGSETVVVTLAAGTYIIGAPASATVTIADNVPVVTVVATDAAAGEVGPDTGTFTITRTGDLNVALVVNFTVGGTATVNSDYANTLGTQVTIQAGQASATRIVTPIQDGAIEGAETVVLTLAAGEYQIGSPSSATVTIADTPVAVVTVTATDPNASEAGTDTGTFTISRTGPTDLALVVNFTVGGTATVNADYANTLGTSVTIQAGQTSVTRTVTPILDAVLEGNETVVLTLAAGEYQIGAPSSATVTIADNVPVVTVVATDAAAGEVGANTGTFTITRTGDLNIALVVNFTVGGTATVNADYTNTIGTSVTIQAGQASATRVVTPIHDGTIEPAETVVLTLAAGQYQIGSPSSATVTIADAPVPVVTVVATDAAAAEAGTDTGTFTISRTGPTDLALVVNFTVGGTATVNADYANTLGTSVTIQAGQTSVTRTVTPILDAVLEGSETVVLTLAAGEYQIGAPSSGTVTIADNVPVVTVVATDAAAGEVGANTGTFTITRTGDLNIALVVNFTVGGTATVNSDYTNTIGTSVTIQAGQASATRVVTPIHDGTIEPAETVVLTLAAGQYQIGSPSSATVTIADAPVPVVATDAAAAEAATNTGTFTISRTGPTDLALVVNFTVGGTATVNSDYANTLGTSVTIPAGQTSATRVVTPIDDVVVEGNETVVLTLAAGQYQIGAQNTATATITSNE